MKQFILIFFTLYAMFTINAQNIELSFANAQITNDGMDDFYEADVIITSSITYSQGSGQFFLDYNTAAFGTLINGSGGITYERPDTTILGGQTTVDVGGTIIPLGSHYGSFIINDSSDSKVSFIWQQNGSGGMIGDNIPANTPTVLVHLKIKYITGQTALDTNLCFDNTTPFDDQFFTACGPYDPLVGFTFVDANCINEAGTQIFDYTKDCVGAALPVIVCAGGTTTYENGSWDNGVPDANTTAIIKTIMTVGAPSRPSFSACELIIEATGSLTILDTRYVSVENNITNHGVMFVSHGGSLVQVNEDAVTINNGTLTVQKRTSAITARNYIAMSSPMSAETRDGVYASSRAVFGIIPSNFVPYDIDLTAFPEFAGAENFLDDNNDYLDPFLGNRALPDPGIGTLVFPSPSDDSPINTYNLNFTQGTLNSGIISVPINYNGPATTNNYNLLGNPYASAIDVTAFLNANPAVNEVYYWDHITDPTADLPGFGTSNFSMNDISMRNAMMGLAAVNGGSAPAPFMASGQGFGIKADQSQMASNTPVVFSNSLRVTGNNDDLRSSETITEIDKLWLNLTTPIYEDVVAQTGIGFTPNATAGFDPGYDSPRLGTFLSLFTNLDGEYLGIQGREAFDPSIELILGFSTSVVTQEAYTISIDHLEGINIENAPVYLIDHLNNTITNLKDSDYSFTAVRGIQPERFTVVFEERDVLSVDEDSFRESDIHLYPNPATDQVILSYAGDASLEKVIVTDLNGKLVKEFSLKTFSQKQQLDVSALAKGVYFLQIISDQNTAVKKLIIK